jgi:hypothetical protein
MKGQVRIEFAVLATFAVAWGLDFVGLLSFGTVIGATVPLVFTGLNEWRSSR